MIVKNLSFVFVVSDLGSQLCAENLAFSSSLLITFNYYSFIGASFKLFLLRHWESSILFSQGPQLLNQCYFVCFLVEAVSHSLLFFYFYYYCSTIDDVSSQQLRLSLTASIRAEREILAIVVGSPFAFTVRRNFLAIVVLEAVARILQ